MSGTLLDYLDTDLDIISIGCNPSPLSVETQCYFGNPRNRFWKALNGSDLIDENLKPEKASMQMLLKKYRIGFTDVVKRTTPGVSDLKAADYRQWSPLLKEKLLRYHPKLCWFHGKVAYHNFLKYTGEKDLDIDWGLQQYRIGQSRVFVTPNPSPANAVYSLDDLIDWFRVLKSELIKL